MERSPARHLDRDDDSDALVTVYQSTLAEGRRLAIHLEAALGPEDFERRRLSVQTVLIGNSAITALSKGADKSVPYWGREIVKKIPMSTVHKVNKVLGPRFVTKYGTKQGVLVLSKQVPLGLGIGVGAGANYLVGRTDVGTARKVFGPAPAYFATQTPTDEREILEPYWVIEEARLPLDPDAEQADSTVTRGPRVEPPVVSSVRT
jgi:hypothetical protein